MLIDRILARIPSWSAISRLGKSPLLHLTILAPFIGWLILFNQQVVELLTVSKNIIFDNEQSGASYTLARLHQVYFGLVALGSASFIFTLFCPSLVKETQSEEDYVSRKREILSQPSRATLITELSQKYIDSHPENSTPTALQRTSFPTGIENLFHDSLEAVYRRTDMNDGSSIYLSATDNILFDKLIEMLANRRRVERDYWQSFHIYSDSVQTDLLKVEFNLAEYSKPLWRLTASFLYTLGFGLLAIPTIETTFKILHRLLVG